MMKTKGKVPGRDFTVVDVRGEDYIGGHIKGAINQSSQTFHHGGVEEIREKTKNVPQVIFHCQLSQVRFVFFLDCLSYFAESHSDGMGSGVQSPPGYVRLSVIPPHQCKNETRFFHVNVYVPLALCSFHRRTEEERG